MNLAGKDVNKKSHLFERWDFFGADGGTRTRDLLITNQLLYQLSHISVASHNGRYYTINDLKKQPLF